MPRYLTWGGAFAPELGQFFPELLNGTTPEFTERYLPAKGSGKRRTGFPSVTRPIRPTPLPGGLLRVPKLIEAKRSVDAGDHEREHDKGDDCAGAVVHRVVGGDDPVPNKEHYDREEGNTQVQPAPPLVVHAQASVHGISHHSESHPFCTSPVSGGQDCRRSLADPARPRGLGFPPSCHGFEPIEKPMPCCRS